MKNDSMQKARDTIKAAHQKGKLATFGAYLRLSGPGWLQSAVTIGGGSLSNSLYLGVLVGFWAMWVQPLAMLLGVVMLSAISYVALSTDEPPLQAINRHVSPVLGWGWLIASMMANMVWSLPQYALSAGALQQNLFPGFFGWGDHSGIFGSVQGGTIAASAIVLAIALINVTIYNRGGAGIKIFETTIKVIIGLIVICFFGVILKLTFTDGSGLYWSEILAGLIPDIRVFSEPASAVAAEISKVTPDFQSFWSDIVVSRQRDVMIGAAATAVGINMTFLLPYSMLRKGWNRDFRGLAIFDLATGLVIPFTLATGCVVIASANQFHAEPSPGFLGEETEVGALVEPAPHLVGEYRNLANARLLLEMDGEEAAHFASLSFEEQEAVRAELPLADRRMAAMLVRRDSFDLADSLAPLLGTGPSKYIFGLGVVAMALNAITMLMLINGLCLCEMLGKPARGKTQFIGSLMPTVGVLGAFFWNQAQMWLAVPTSVFAATLLPVAYLAFMLLLNQKKFMGEDIPRGGVRFVWNILMIIAVALSAALSFWNLWSRLGYWGIAIFVGFILAVVVVGEIKKSRERSA